MIINIFPGIELQITGAQEKISMGGPYVGNLSISGNEVAENCIVDNFIYKDDAALLFFVRYHIANKYEYFTINFYSLTEDKVFEFMKEFDMVYLKQFVDKNKLEIYKAFNDNLPQKKTTFDLERETFTKV